MGAGERRCRQDGEVNVKPRKPARPTQREPEWFCGCCGGGPIGNALWCARCLKHVSGRGPLWDQTYESQHGKPCPYQVAR